MATGFKDNNVDLDDILEPRTTTKIADTGFKSNGGVDISNRFENIASGSAPGITGFKKNGSDLNTLFAEIITTPTISPSAPGQQTVVQYTRDGGCYAGIRFASDGTEYIRDASTGGWTANGTWLDSGSASDVWVEYVNTGGSSNFNQSNPGAGRHNLGTTRDWMEIRTSYGESTTTGYFRFWDAATGGSQLTNSPTSTVEWSCERVEAVVNIPVSSVTRSSDASTVWANLQFVSGTGVVRTSSTSTPTEFSWVDSGTWYSSSSADPSLIWISRTINSGTFDLAEGSTTASPVNNETAWSFKLKDATANNIPVTGSITVSFWDSAAKDHLLDSQTISFSADYESLSISPVASSRTYVQQGSATGQSNLCYVGVRWDNNGTQYRLQDGTDNTWIAEDTWLDGGSGSDVWVEWDGTAWNSLNPSGRLQLSSDRIWREYRVSTGISSTSGVWRFWDAASGGSSLGTTPTRTYTCQRVPIVSPSSANVVYSVGSVCYANISFNSNGTEYQNSNGALNNLSTTRVDWLDDGDTDDVWLEAIVGTTGGSGLDTNNSSATGTRLALTSTRTYKVVASSLNTTSFANMTFKFWSASSGGTVLGQSSVLLSATYIDEP